MDAATVPMDATAAPRPMRVVIDTNIWLDMLVFDDPGTRRLASMVLADRDARLLQALATDAMRAELADVVRRSCFRLSADGQLHVLQRFDASTLPVQTAPDCRLACRDPDDRKFLDLAVRERCTLLSRDKALLAARRHARRRFGIAIGTVPDFYRTLSGNVTR